MFASSGSSRRRRVGVASSSGRRRVVVASLIPCLWGKLQNLSFSKVSKPLAKENIQRKEKQSAHAKANGPQEIAAKKRKANEEAAIRGAASSSAQAEASSWSAATAFLPKSKKAARPFLEPESPPTAKASSSGRPDASWSYNKDHYGARREWSWWRGKWYYRDEAGSRWILWNR